jgi:hypothetical protein
MSVVELTKERARRRRDDPAESGNVIEVRGLRIASAIRSSTKGWISICGAARSRRGRAARAPASRC